MDMKKLVDTLVELREEYSDAFSNSTTTDGRIRADAKIDVVEKLLGMLNSHITVVDEGQYKELVNKIVTEKQKEIDKLVHPTLDKIIQISNQMVYTRHNTWNDLSHLLKNNAEYDIHTFPYITNDGMHVIKFEVEGWVNECLSDIRNNMKNYDTSYEYLYCRVERLKILKKISILINQYN